MTTESDQVRLNADSVIKYYLTTESDSKKFTNNNPLVERNMNNRRVQPTEKNKKMKKLLIIITLSILALDAFAQRRVSGVVMDESGEPLFDASVIEFGVRRITTNVDGEFTLTTTRDSAELRIHFFGYGTQAIKIENDTTIMVVLEIGERRRVSGYVFFENEPVRGASIRERGTPRGVITSTDGSFQFTTPRDTSEISISWFGAETQHIKITSDTIVTIRLEPYIAETNPFRDATIGMNYDIANFLFGVSFSRGFYVHCQVGGFDPTFSYRISAQTNFNRDYGFAGSVGFARPRRRMDWISLNYTHKNLSRNVDFNFHNVGIRGYTFIRRPIGTTLSVKPAFQSLNEKNNFGLIMGLHRNFFGYWRGVNVSLSAGYFSDYWTYSISAQHRLPRIFVARHIPLVPRPLHLRVRVSYERIDQFDFFSVGLTHTYGRRRVR